MNEDIKHLVDLIVLLLASPDESDRFAREAMLQQAWEQPEHLIWVERTEELLKSYELSVEELYTCAKRAIVLINSNAKLPSKKRAYLDLLVMAIYREHINWTNLSETVFPREKPVHDELPFAADDEEDS